MADQKKKVVLKFYSKLRSIGNGNSYSLPIPKEIFDALQLKPREMLELYIEGEKIIIEKILKKEDKKKNE